MSLSDDLAVCVGCGLCLPHCPTFRITGEESHSPRGRISLIRASLEDDRTSTGEARPFLDTCVQCRGCEPACPSGVEYGRILAAANRRDEQSGRRPGIAMRLFLYVLTRPALMRIVARVGLIANALPGSRFAVPSRFRLAGLSVRQGARIDRAVDDPSIWLFTGCVMDSWFRPVHRATLELLEACGEAVATPVSDGCCGALHMHAGDEAASVGLAQRVMQSMPGFSPIVVDSAGCGAMLKEYGDLLNTDDARAFSRRVLDVNEWIHGNSEILLEIRAQRGSLQPNDGLLVVQEPCHLRHVQKVSLADVLEQFVPVTRLDDDGLCCGAGGAYSFVQSEMATAIRGRKSEAIRRAAGGAHATVVTSNPGCHLHLAADGHDLVSSAEVIARVLGLSEKRRVRTS